MSNTARQRVIVDLTADGEVIIWTTRGPISCHSERQAADVLKRIAKSDNLIWTRAQDIPQEYTSTETYDEFIARGGRVDIIPPNVKRTLTKAESDLVSLESLGL